MFHVCFWFCCLFCSSTRHSVYTCVVGRPKKRPSHWLICMLDNSIQCFIHMYIRELEDIRTADCVSVRKFAYSVMVFIQNISYTYNANRVTRISLRNTQFSNGTTIHCTCTIVREPWAFERYRHSVQTPCTLSGAFEARVHPCTLGYMSIAEQLSFSKLWTHNWQLAVHYGCTMAF